MDRTGRLVFPGDSVADCYGAAVEDFGEHAPAPAAAHRLLQAHRGFFHQLARPRFAVDTHAALADAQHTPAGVLENDARDHEVGPARVGLERGADLFHQLV